MCWDSMRELLQRTTLGHMAFMDALCRSVDDIARPRTIARRCATKRLPSGGSGLRDVGNTSVAVDAAKRRPVDGITNAWTRSAGTRRHAAERLHNGNSGMRDVRKASSTVDASKRRSVDGTARIWTLTERTGGYVAERLPSGGSGSHCVGRARNAVHATERSSVVRKRVGSL